MRSTVHGYGRPVVAAVIGLVLALSPSAVAEAAGRGKSKDTNVNVACDQSTGRGDTAALLQAIDDAKSDPSSVHNIILGKNCTYTLTQEIDIDVTHPIVISGTNSVITKTAAGSFGLFFIDLGGNLRLYGLTLRGGNPVNYGGAITNDWGRLWIVNCTIVGNSADFGGAIFSYGGETNIHGSTISGNSALVGGGILAGGAGTLMLDKTTVVSNSAAAIGGGVYFESGLATLRHSLISSNVAETGAGTFNDTKGLINAYGSLWSGNSASVHGGAVDNAGGFYGDSIGITGNSATDGGGFYNVPGDPAAVLTLSGGYVRSNVATRSGGGIINTGNPTTQARVLGTVVTGNRPQDCLNVTGCQGVSAERRAPRDLAAGATMARSRGWTP
jgi:hypothetical protein